MAQKLFSFRPVERADLPLLAAWHRQPHVLAWWHNPPSVSELQDYCRVDLDIPVDNRFYVALLDQMPFGFMQCYRAVACHSDGWWLDEQDTGVFGIDQFIADPGRLDQGFGRAMIRTFTDTLLRQPAVSRIQADPHPRNGRAIRCYEKSGFRAAQEVETPDGRAILMYRDASG